MPENARQALERRDMTDENLRLWKITLEEKKATATVLIGVIVHDGSLTPVLCTGMHEKERIIAFLKSCVDVLSDGEVVHEHK